MVSESERALRDGLAETLLPLRLRPGDDLRRSLEAAVQERGHAAAFVVSGIGSLSSTQLRYAGADRPTLLTGDVEVLTMSGSLGETGSHLHIGVSDRDGRVLGGHAGYGCVVRTTAEVLVVLLPGWRFSREPDAVTGYEELVIRGRRLG